jgi:hypothetical protein
VVEDAEEDSKRNSRGDPKKQDLKKEDPEEGDPKKQDSKIGKGVIT